MEILKNLPEVTELVNGRMHSMNSDDFMPEYEGLNPTGRKSNFYHDRTLGRFCYVCLSDGVKALGKLEGALHSQLFKTGRATVPSSTSVDSVF